MTSAEREEEVRAFESVHKVKLPREYLDFLLQWNGAECRQDREIRLSSGDAVLCDCLFGLNQQDELSLGFWNDEFAGELPGHCVTIGSSPGGGFFLLLEDESGWAVYYYDHSHSLSGSGDDENTYSCDARVADLLALALRPLKASAL